MHAGSTSSSSKKTESIPRDQVREVHRRVSEKIATRDRDVRAREYIERGVIDVDVAVCRMGAYVNAIDRAAQRDVA